MAKKSESGLAKPHPVLSSSFQRWLDDVFRLPTREERLSAFAVKLSSIDSAIARLKLQRSEVKRHALSEAKSLGIIKFLAATHRTALVLKIPLTFTTKNSNASTARAVRSLLVKRFGKAKVQGMIKKRTRLTRTVTYEISESLRNEIHALNDPLLELELAKLLGCTIEASAGRPTQALLEQLLAELRAQE